MQRFIDLAPDDRVLYFRQAAAALPYPLPPAVIEKDFWVSWLLHTLLELPATRDRLTFKGGTSLSKAYGIITGFRRILTWCWIAVYCCPRMKETTRPE